MKLSTVSGRLAVSLTQVPGLGSGTFEFNTGNQAELDVACSLNFPKINYNKKKSKQKEPILIRRKLKMFFFCAVCAVWYSISLIK